MQSHWQRLPLMAAIRQLSSMVDTVGGHGPVRLPDISVCILFFAPSRADTAVRRGRAPRQREEIGMQSFALATLALDGRDQAAVVVVGRYYRLDRLIPDLPAVGLRALMDNWDGLIERLSPLVKSLAGNGAANAALVPEPNIVAPLRYPNKLVCVGAVYSDHLAQFNLPPERWPTMPMFLRPPTTSIVGPGRTIHIPPTTQQFDWGNRDGRDHRPPTYRWHGGASESGHRRLLDRDRLQLPRSASHRLQSGRGSRSCQGAGRNGAVWTNHCTCAVCSRSSVSRPSSLGKRQAQAR